MKDESRTIRVDEVEVSITVTAFEIEDMHRFVFDQKRLDPSDQHVLLGIVENILEELEYYKQEKAWLEEELTEHKSR